MPLALDEQPEVVALVDAPAAPVRHAKPTLAYQSAPSAVAQQRRRATVIGDPRRDLRWPVGLVVVGALAYFGRTVYADGSLITGLVDASVQMALNTLVTVALVLGMGRLLDFDFGSTSATLLKLVAASIFPNGVAALATLYDSVPTAILAFALSLGLTYAVFKRLFALELREAFFCMLVACVLDVLSWTFAARIVHALLR